MVCMAAKFRNKSWLYELELTHWLKYIDFILGEKASTVLYQQSQHVLHPTLDNARISSFLLGLSLIRSAHPPGLCKYLAAIIASVPRHRGVDSVQLQQTEQQLVVSTVTRAQHCGDSLQMESAVLLDQQRWKEGEGFVFLCA